MFNLFFILLAGLIFTYFCKKNILWGIGLIIIFLPSYLWRFKILSLPSTFLELMLIILFFVWLFVKKPYQKEFWKNIRIEKKWLIILSCWLLISFVSWLLNPTIKSLGLWRAYFLEPLLFFVVLVTSIKNNKDYQLIIKSSAVLIFYLAIFAIIQNFTGANLPAAYDYPNVKRLTSVFSYPNALSLLTASMSGFLIAYYYFKQRQWEYLFLGILGVFLSWWSVSQGALVGMLFALATVVLVKIYNISKTRKQKKIFLAFVISFLLFLLSTPVVRGLYQEVFHPVLDLQASSMEIRSSQWQETWHMLKNNWLTGAGLNAYQIKLIPYHQVQWLEIFLYPHNIFLNFWTELGIFGLLCFLFILYFIAQEIKNLFLNKNKLAWPLLTFWLIWLIHGLVDVPYFKNDLSLLFFIFLALTIRAKYVDNNLQTKQILV
jgi:putative inorganic carbon (HCO3(-)) transporter